MSVDRRTKQLIGVLIVLVVVVVALWASGGGSAPTVTSTPPRAAAQRSGSAATEDAVPGHVNLEKLAAARGEPADAERNPFRFQARQPVTPPGGVLPPPRPVNQAALAPAAPPVPTGPPPPPPIPLKFIGIVTQGATRVAVLSDGKSTPQSGKEGDIILGQYRIIRIGNESIEMAYVDGRGRQTIRLTGQ